MKHTLKYYNVEAMMYFCVKNIKFIRFSKKLNYKYYDLYEVKKPINKQAYKLILSKNISKIHNIFHISLLKSYKKKFHNAKSSSLIIIDDEN